MATFEENGQPAKETEPAELVVLKQPEVGLSAIEKQEIEISISTAKQYPRVQSKALHDMTSMACRDQKTASACIYSMPRGGKKIIGKSVRLAEIVASCWGNIAAGADIIGEDGRWVYAVGYCRDLEHNVFMRFRCRRRIVDKYGKRYDDDMIAVTGAAAAAIAFRNVVFKVVPSIISDTIFDRCQAVAIGNREGFAKRREQVVADLEKVGASKEKILGAMNRRAVADLDMEDVLALIGTLSSIQNKETTIEDAFPDILDPVKPKAKTDNGTEGATVKPQTEATPEEPKKNLFDKRS